MATPKSPAGALVLISASLLCLVLGSIHAFSVFLLPLEEGFGLSRSIASLIYSFALVFLTLAVLFGHRIFSRLRPAPFVFWICVGAAAGALIAAFAPTFELVLLGYSALFGATNGLGYGFGLQLSAQANPGREGLAMGLVTASYALGAVVSPALYSWAVVHGGFQLAMIGLAGALVLIAPVCSTILSRSGANFLSTHSNSAGRPVAKRQLSLLWLGYGAGVAAGLMAIGHATGIVGFTGMLNMLWVAPVAIAIFNLIGSTLGGWLADRTHPVVLLAGLPLISTFSLLLVAFASSVMVALMGLGLVGFTYGALIAAYPAVIAKMFGVFDSTRIYGRVFTAWGTAGLFAPWLAGYLFDRSGDYVLALVTAAALGIVSSIAAMWVHLITKPSSSAP